MHTHGSCGRRSTPHTQPERGRQPPDGSSSAAQLLGACTQWPRARSMQQAGRQRRARGRLRLGAAVAAAALLLALLAPRVPTAAGTPASKQRKDRSKGSSGPAHKQQAHRQQQQEEGAAAAPAAAPPAWTDVQLAFAPDRFYNPSLVAYPSGAGRGASAAYCAIKHTQHRKAPSKVWWLNSIQLCNGSLDGLQRLRCAPFHPWGDPALGRLDECEVDARVRGGRTDSRGIGDTKLWVWPGKGVYAIFGHKPNKSLLVQPTPSTQQPEAAAAEGGASPSVWAMMRAHPALRPMTMKPQQQGGGASGAPREGEAPAGRFCRMQLVYHQWLVQVWSDPAQSPGDPWKLVGQDPLPLLPAPWLHAYPASQPYVMEKNWMPWVYREPVEGEAEGQAGGRGVRERLMVTYLVVPHAVWELLPNGTALPRWSEPSTDPRVEAKFGSFSVHGGPPVVWVPPGLQGHGLEGEQAGGRGQGGEGYYLGVMHHIERWRRGRLYRHFAFKFEPRPPFRITAVSDELPLVYSGAKSKVAFVTGLHLEVATGQVYVSYGSADLVSRLLVLNVSSLEALFSGHMRFRDVGVATAGGYTLPGAGSGHEGG